MSNSNYFEDENVLRDFGFTGFKSVKELTQSRCFEISAQPGVYMVLNTTNDYNIMDESVGGHFKGKNPTVPVKLLNENICEKLKKLDKKEFEFYIKSFNYFYDAKVNIKKINKII